MATPIPCDYAECEALADVLISDLANGDGYGWCGPHYLAVARSMVEAADAADADAEAAQADAEAEARLAQLGRVEDPTASEPSSDAGDQPDDDAGSPPAADLDPNATDRGTVVSGDPGSTGRKRAAPAIA